MYARTEPLVFSHRDTDAEGTKDLTEFHEMTECWPLASNSWYLDVLHPMMLLIYLWPGHQTLIFFTPEKVFFFFKL